MSALGLMLLGWVLVVAPLVHASVHEHGHAHSHSPHGPPTPPAAPHGAGSFEHFQTVALEGAALVEPRLFTVTAAHPAPAPAMAVDVERPRSEEEPQGP